MEPPYPDEMIIAATMMIMQRIKLPVKHQEETCGCLIDNYKYKRLCLDHAKYLCDLVNHKR